MSKRNKNKNREKEIKEVAPAVVDEGKQETLVLVEPPKPPPKITDALIYIPRHIYTKIMYWVNKSNLEVSGFGKVVFSKEDNFFYVKDVYLLDQLVGSAHTDIDPTALGKLMYESREVEGDLNFWWHSHVNMDVFWSGTDKETIEEIGKQGYCLATVFNKKYEMRSALCFKASGMFGDTTVFKDEMKTVIYDTIPEETKTAWDNQYTSKVKEEKPKVTSYHGGAGNYSGVGDYSEYGWYEESYRKLKMKMKDFDFPEDSKKIIERVEKQKHFSYYDPVEKAAAALYDMSPYEVSQGIKMMSVAEEADFYEEIEYIKESYSEVPWT